MSRRFGRQQKRKLLEQLTQAENKCARLEREAALIRHESYRNKEAVERTARVLGEYFFTLEPRTVELRELQRLGEYWRVETKPWVMDHLAPDFVLRSVGIIKALPVLKCRSLLDELHGAIHYRFTFNGKEAGYAISQSTIMQQPGFKEAARRNVAEAVTRLFMDTEVSQ